MENVYVSYTISAILPFTYQNLLKLVEIWRSVNKKMHRRTIYDWELRYEVGLDIEWTLYNRNWALLFNSVYLIGKRPTGHRAWRWLRRSTQYFWRTDPVRQGSAATGSQRCQITRTLFNNVSTERPVLQFQLQGHRLCLRTRLQDVHLRTFQRLSD